MVEGGVRVAAQRAIYRAGRSKWTKLVTVVVAVLVLVSLTLPTLVSWEDMSLATSTEPERQGPYSKPSIAGFERFTQAEEELQIFDEIPSPTKRGVDLVDCNEVEEPSVPSQKPDWIKTPDEMRKMEGVEEIQDGVFVHGIDMVITKCEFHTLADAIDYTMPDARFKAGKRDDNPCWDIFMECGSGTHTITFENRINFGRKSRYGFGVFRFMALDHNVIFDGNGDSALFRIEQGAHVTFYGLTLKNAAIKSYDLKPKGIPRGGYQGAAVLVMGKANFVAYHCDFEDNHAYCINARFGGGGAIKGETNSKIIIWGCYFQNNSAAVGGAIAISSATVIYVAKSTFEGNEAVGGLDGSANNKGRQRPKLLIKGGAIRVDSISGHASEAEHVLLCNSKFHGNAIVYHEMDYKRYGASKKKILKDLNAGAAAVYTWNTPGNLMVDKYDKHFLTVKGCAFEYNEERIEANTKKSGLFVFQAEGSGHASIKDLTFKNNKVRGAVAKFDNSNKYNTDLKFMLLMANIKFLNNGPDVRTLAFESKAHTSNCILRGINGLPNVNADCSDAAKGMVSENDPVMILSDGLPLVQEFLASGTPAPTPKPETPSPTPKPETPSPTPKPETPSPTPKTAPGPEEEGASPSPAPGPEEEEEEEASPSPAPGAEEEEEEEASPSPAPGAEEEEEEEASPSPAPGAEEEEEEEASPSPAPGAEEEEEEEASPSPAPGAEAEEEASPSPAPGAEVEEEESPSPSPGTEEEEEED